ncbi:hypothetical protein DNK49_12250 [Azoarcus communis]|uniref:Uncharacterized protein n=1 Tax=Parazoarcus communis SWub3 = DSM 12120 TaxID=1121029 RepID=A0A323UVD3_9RHOO|nr:hypothetical protein DNK49_12250 [Azoarcus communis] [Parazoarcus communis SWub3 = DSM 12120]
MYSIWTVNNIYRAYDNMDGINFFSNQFSWLNLFEKAYNFFNVCIIYQLFIRKNLYHCGLLFPMKYFLHLRVKLVPDCILY